MKKKNTKTSKGNGKKSIDLEAYCERADKSARHFIGVLCQSVTIDLPSIEGKTREARAKKQFAILDRILDAFTTAQSDAIKYAGAQVADVLGLPPLWTLDKKND